MTAGYERAIKLTERIHVDDYYTDGVVLGQIYKVARLGHIMVEVLEKGAVHGDIWGYGIDAFRAHWWLVQRARTDA